MNDEENNNYTIKIYVWLSTRWCSNPCKPGTYGHVAMLLKYFDGCGFKLGEEKDHRNSVYISLYPENNDEQGLSFSTFKEDFYIKYKLSKGYNLSIWVLKLSEDEMKRLYARFNELFNYKADSSSYVNYIPKAEGGQNMTFSPQICAYSSREGLHNCTSLVFDLLEAAGHDFLPHRKSNTLFVASSIFLRSVMLGYSCATTFDLANPRRGKHTITRGFEIILLILLFFTAIFPALNIFYTFRNCCKGAKKILCGYFSSNGFSNAACVSLLLTLAITAFIFIKDIFSGNPFDGTDPIFILGLIVGGVLFFMYIVLGFRYDSKNVFIRPSGLLGSLELREEHGKIDYCKVHDFSSEPNLDLMMQDDIEFQSLNNADERKDDFEIPLV